MNLSLLRPRDMVMKVKKIWVDQSFMLTCRAVRVLFLRQPTVLLDTHRQKLRYGEGWDVGTGTKEAAILGALLIFPTFPPTTNKSLCIS